MEDELVDVSDTEPAGSVSSWADAEEFDIAMNCHGVILVRMLSATKLPCPVGSSVVCVASLPPFIGCVKTSRTSSYLSSDSHGVSVEWPSENDDGLCPMINAWNSDESPIPSIKIEIRFSPIGLGLLDFTMCSFNVSCHPLLRNPGKWKTRWFNAETNHQLVASRLEDDSSAPRIHLQAMFAPDKPRPTPERTQLQQGIKVSEQDDEEERLTHQDKTKQFNTSTVSKNTQLSKESLEHPEPQENATTARKSHLLHLESFLVPKPCSVCKKLLIGRRAGFMCESCGIVCCSDCQLSVDFHIPCKEKKQKSVSYSESALDRVLSIIAPDESYTRKKSEVLDSGCPTDQKEQREGSKQGGVGTIRVRILKAVIFANQQDEDESFSRDTLNAHKVREGNYYVRITSSDEKKTWRTQGLFSGGSANLQFKDSVMEFNVTHYGEEFWIDCIETSTDEVCGSLFLSVHLLLRDRHEDRGEDSLGDQQPKTGHEGENHGKWLPLRKNARNALATGLQDSNMNASVAGWIEIDARLEENLEKLYSLSDPLDCPKRPPAELNTATLQNNLTRLRLAALRIKHSFRVYHHVVKWENFLHSGISLFLLVYLSLKVEAEYFFCIPVGMVVCVILSNFWFYWSLGIKQNFIQRETKIAIAEHDATDKSIVARPFGIAAIAIHSGRNLFSKDLGVSGKTYCTVFFSSGESDFDANGRPDLTRSIQPPQEIGGTTAIVSADPDWNQLHFCTRENKRLMQTLRQTDHYFSEHDNEAMPWLLFPVFQPIHGGSQKNRDDKRSNNLLGWESSGATVSVLVQLGLGFPETLGKVTFSVARLVREGEIKGWFPITDMNSNSDETPSQVSHGAQSRIPSIFIHLKWKLKTANLPEDEYRELSKRVQKQIWEAGRKDQGRSFTLVENSIGAVNTAFGVSGYLQSVQNTMGAIADTIERIENIFNFTDPLKSTVVFFALAVALMISLYVKARHLVLCVVLFVPNLVNVVLERRTKGARPEGRKKNVPEHDVLNENRHERKDWLGAILVWLSNAFISLPTNEDLRRAFFWDLVRLKKQVSQQKNSKIRVQTLMLLWRAKWFSEIEFCGGEHLLSQEVPRKKAFALIEGQRFVWWTSVEAFDAADLAAGYIALRGHSGVGSTSPTEMQGVDRTCQDRVVTVFGRGSKGQKRLTFLLPDKQSMSLLKSTVAQMADKTD